MMTSYHFISHIIIIISLVMFCQNLRRYLSIKIILNEIEKFVKSVLNYEAFSLQYLDSTTLSKHLSENLNVLVCSLYARTNFVLHKFGVNFFNFRWTLDHGKTLVQE